MKIPMMALGLILVAGGGLGLYFGGIPYTRKEGEIGPLQITTERTHEIPKGVSGSAVGAGAVLLLVGVLKKGKKES